MCPEGKENGSNFLTNVSWVSITLLRRIVYFKRNTIEVVKARDNARAHKRENLSFPGTRIIIISSMEQNTTPPIFAVHTSRGEFFV